jgi:hypothetical protein
LSRQTVFLFLFRVIVYIFSDSSNYGVKVIVNDKTRRYAGMARFAVLLFLVVAVSASCHLMRMKKVTLSINGRPLTVEIARTNKQRANGLMFRDELEWNEGMLFVFRYFRSG